MRYRSLTLMMSRLSVLLVLLVGLVGPVHAGCAEVPEGERATKQERQRGEEQKALGINTAEDVVEFYLEAAMSGDIHKARTVIILDGLSDDALRDNMREAKSFVESAGGLHNLGIAEELEERMGASRFVKVRVVDSPLYAIFDVIDSPGYRFVGITLDEGNQSDTRPSSDPSY